MAEVVSAPGLQVGVVLALDLRADPLLAAAVLPEAVPHSAEDGLPVDLPLEGDDPAEVRLAGVDALLVGVADAKLQSRLQDTRVRPLSRDFAAALTEQEVLDMRSVTSRAGKTRPLALVVAFGVLATALYAYRHVFQRPGEEAISLVPADAVVVASFDLTPGPDQVAFFARLAKAMHDEHLDDPFQTVLKNSTHDHGLFSALRPQLGVSYAAAGWKRNQGDSQVSDGVVIAAIKDPAATETILAKFGTQERSGTFSAFHLKDNNGYACVLKSYLVAADSIQNLNRVAMVAHGDGASVSGLQSFRDARSRLPGSANLMLFVDLSIANTATSKTKQNPGIAWATCSATLRENGIELLMKSPTAS